jgi:3-hydroxybutyryl-CoA dehydratase
MSFTTQHLYFDDVEVGQEWDSPCRTLTEADIVNFAGLSGDFNAIHMDHEFAKTTAFQKPIAHGLLGMAISSGLAVQTPAMRTLAFREIKEWHFKEPIFIGDTLHVKTKVLAKEPRARGRRGYITWQRQIINQAGKVVQEGVSVTLVEGRGMMKEGDEASKP